MTWQCAQRDRRLSLEPLEDRRMLAVIAVNTEADIVDPTDDLTSLREAIAQANTALGADEITFDFGHDGPATIALQLGELVITDELTINGLGSDLLTIDAGHGADGDPGTLDGTRVFHIDNGTADEIFVGINGLTVTGGDVAGDGGGILNAEQLALFNTVVTGNAAQGGGGLFTSTGVTLTDSQISDNTAAFYSGGGIRSIGGDVIITQSEVSRNSAEWEFDPAPNGGGVSSTAGDVFVTDSTINDNATSGRGGGIDAGGRVEVQSSTISGNSAGTDGGGVYSEAVVEVDETDLVENEAQTGGGGGIFALGDATLGGSEVVRNFARRSGVGLYAHNVTITDSLISENSSTPLTHGGGVFGNGDVVIDNSEISDNAGGVRGNQDVRVSLTTIARNSGRGGILASGNVTVTDSSITENSASSGGGIQADGNVVVTGSEILRNTAIVRGGGVSAGGDASITDSVVAENSVAGAEYGFGGGVYADNEVTITNSTVSDNRAEFDGGGVHGRNVTVVSSTISGNTSDGGDGGGGIYAFFNAVVRNSTIDQNRSERSGGGVLANRDIEISDSTITDNSADANGGGVISAGGNATVVGSTVSGNVTYDDGSAAGGIRADNVTVTSSTVSGNIGIGVVGGYVTVTSSTVSENSGDRAGGIRGDTVTVIASKISGNSAERSGGGIAAGEFIQIESSEISANSAVEDGGGIWARGLVRIQNSTISANESLVDGGGVFVVESDAATILNSTIAGNEATARGGGLFANGAELFDVLVAGNTAGPGPDVSGSVTASYSLFGESGGANITGSNNLTNIDPLLGPLADNGGFPLPDGSTIHTHALLPGSPAIDMGDPNFDPLDPDGDPNTDDAMPFDQRGTPFYRVQNGRVDVGAFELQQPLAADFNSDEIVDGADFLRQQRGFGTPAPDAVKADGDADNDTDVDSDDVRAWEAQFGLKAASAELSAFNSQHTGSEATGRVIPTAAVSAPTRADLVDAALAYDLRAATPARNNWQADARAASATDVALANGLDAQFNEVANSQSSRAAEEPELHAAENVEPNFELGGSLADEDLSTSEFAWVWSPLRL